MKKRLKLLIFIMSMFFVVSFCLNSQAQISQSASKDLLDMVIEKDSKYSNYDVETVSGNFDSKGSMGYFFILTEKTVNKDDFFDYCVDIWYGSGSTVSKVAGQQYIMPEGFGSIKLGGKTYFRYDLAYATDSQTILLGVTGGKCTESLRAPGHATFNNSNSFTVLCSAYDLLKMKEDDFSIGHTWKNYYFYVDSKGFHEYAAKQITNKEFNTYPDSGTIIKNLNKEFSKMNTKVSYKFLKRSNNLIHINIDIETSDSVSHSYRTYQIGKNNKLTLLDSGEGRYVNKVSSLK